MLITQDSYIVYNSFGFNAITRVTRTESKHIVIAK